jgi:hypothetical protein
MPRVPVRKALFLAILLCVAAAVPASADCKFHAGERIVLFSTGDDPDVLAWDSQYRLRDYHAATFDEAQRLLPHALLLARGTRAVVQTCASNFVVSPFLDRPDDAVEIVILSGPYRTRANQWILGADIRGVYRPLPKHR